MTDPKTQSEYEPHNTGSTFVNMDTKQRRLVPALILAAPMVIAFAVMLATSSGMNGWAVSGPRLSAGNYQLMVLHMFAHGGLIHIACNMMALIVLGPLVMERLGPLAARSFTAFVALFLGCGIAGAALWLAINPDSNIPMLGASGAIFGLLGFLMRHPDPHGEPIPLISAAMARAFIEWIKLHVPLVLIFIVPMLLGSDFFGLAWEAHLGGFVAGLLLCRPALALAQRN